MTGNLLTQGGLRPGEQQGRAGQPAISPDAQGHQQLLVAEREQVARDSFRSGRGSKRFHRGRRDQLIRAARHRLRRVVAITRPSLQFSPQAPGERFAVLAHANEPTTGRVRIRRKTVVNEHDDEAPGPLRHPDLFDDRRQLRVRAVVHRPLQPIQIDFGRHPAYGPSAADHTLGHAEHHGPAAAVRHADRPLDRRAETPLPLTAPLLEIQILIFQIVRYAMIESFEEFLDLPNRSHDSLPPPRPADCEPTAMIIGGGGAGRVDSAPGSSGLGLHVTLLRRSAR